ncbi:MAG TPA: hypothetical protein VIM75_24410 [Ohtaekwangia sp.]|uniref:hypothetical protein n=1 Tax=Ohtaekwangia sp. TaxID=2066019 RepID=UPI002F943AD7
MSKKKNTLKDLDDFLKQQAATLVSPAKLSDQIETPPPAAPTPVAPEVTPASAAEQAPVAAQAAPAHVVSEISNSSILESIKALAEKEGTTVRKKLYDIILQSAAHQSLSAEDTMLINTILYLKSGDDWKEVIREYWKKRA